MQWISALPTAYWTAKWAYSKDSVARRIKCYLWCYQDKIVCFTISWPFWAVVNGQFCLCKLFISTFLSPDLEQKRLIGRETIECKAIKKNNLILKQMYFQRFQDISLSLMSFFHCKYKGNAVFLMVNIKHLNNNFSQHKAAINIYLFFNKSLLYSVFPFRWFPSIKQFNVKDFILISQSAHDLILCVWTKTNNISHVLYRIIRSGTAYWRGWKNYHWRCFHTASTMKQLYPQGSNIFGGIHSNPVHLPKGKSTPKTLTAVLKSMY